MWLLLGTLSDITMGKHLLLAQDLFSTYIRNSSWCWVVYEMSSSRLVSILWSQLRNDHNFWKALLISADMQSVTAIRVTPTLYFDSFWRANFTEKYKFSFQWVFFLGKAGIIPFRWTNMSLYTGITSCRVTVCRFVIDRIQYRNDIITAMTSLKSDHLCCIVNSGR